MKEIEPDEKFPNDTKEQTFDGELISAGTSAEVRAILVMLMRLYDVNMALLNHFDAKQADKVWDAHNEGDHFNPTIYIPGPVEEDA